MKIEKMFNVRLSQKEVEQAILDYLKNTLPEPYYSHIKDHGFMIDFNEDEYVLIIDGLYSTYDPLERRVQGQKSGIKIKVPEVTHDPLECRVQGRKSVGC